MSNLTVHPSFNKTLAEIADAIGLSETQVHEAVLRAYTFQSPEQNGRVADFLKKAAAGGELTVAGLGGSITEGAIAKRGWFVRTVEWLRATFPQTTFRAVNAGIGATPSFLGAFRMEQMVLQHKPDLVFVEFSVNDSSTPPNLLENEILEVYESIVRRCLEAEIAVIQLFMNDKANNGYQRYHSEIAQYYHVPSVSYHNAVYPDGQLICDWSRISPDEVHPNDIGHSLAATCICNYLQSVRDTNAAPAVKPIPEKWLHADTFHKVWARYAWQFQDCAEGAITFRTDVGEVAKWKGALVSEGVGTVRVTVPKGARRVWVQYFHNGGAFETDFNGQRAVCNAAAIGWPRAMWFRLHTGAPLSEDTELTIRTHKQGQVLLLGVLASF